MNSHTRIGTFGHRDLSLTHSLAIALCDAFNTQKGIVVVDVSPEIDRVALLKEIIEKNATSYILLHTKDRRINISSPERNLSEFDITQHIQEKLEEYFSSHTSFDKNRLVLEIWEPRREPNLQELALQIQGDPTREFKDTFWRPTKVTFHREPPRRWNRHNDPHKFRPKQANRKNMHQH